MIDAAWLAGKFADLADLAPLGAGGQKWVYAAVHSTHGRVVLKLIQPGQDIERVRREILAVQQTNSARVPALLSEGRLTTPEGERIWILERRVVGVSVREALNSRRFERAELCRLGRQILEALADSERARIVHRDVKPENLMVDTAGNFWLLDFGYARLLDLSSLTASAALGGFGTLGYAPPEQYRNRKREIDSRADLFALGVTMWECATGSNPFRAGARDAGEVVRRIEGQPLPALVVPGDDGSMRDFILTLMQSRPDHRPGSAADALEWLRNLCPQP